MNWWYNISNLGVEENILTVSNKRNRLTNRMILLSFILTGSYVPILAAQNAVVPFVQVLVLATAILSLFILTKKRKHENAAVLLCILLISHIISVSILIEGSTAKLLLIPISVLGFTMLRGIKRASFLFIYAFLGFFISKYIPEYVDPMIIRQKGNTDFIYAFNIIVVFVGTFYFILQFKLTSKLHEIKIMKQKDTIEKQHLNLKESHKNIRDSITYAKRIQSAILPSEKLVKKHLPESFIFYSPKDIVAGDFYWMEHTKDQLLFAAADCTGHGVPGAMVSVVCNNGLNRSVREYGLTEPAKILDKTREIVIQEFEKSEEEVKDGMDIALVSLKKKAQSENKSESESHHSHSPTHSILQYAGAHNPLWIVRNGAEEIEEIKADKQPIGKFGAEKPFTNHTVELQKGDTIYIFSDGFADQFGGEKGKKFKSKNFKKLLLSIVNEPMVKQREMIAQTFEEWKGSIEQLDDVCVIGVRV